MNTRGLTPKSNDTVKEAVFSGGFGQPDGFGSMLTASVRRDGRFVLTLDYRMHGDGAEHQWGVELDNEQRRALAALATSYEPVLYQEVK